VRRNIWAGIDDQLIGIDLGWPRQPRSSIRCWKIWRTCITTLNGANEQNGANEPGVLNSPHPGTGGSTRWKWVYSPIAQLLYETTNAVKTDSSVKFFGEAEDDETHS
jgi:hypothetical protein